MKRNLLIILSSLLLVACQKGVVYTEFCSIAAEGWHKDSVLYFEPCIANSNTNYQLQITLRHNDNYPYQNLWLFVDICKDSTVSIHDTIECYLANERGTWLGQGLSIYELPLLYENNFQFADSGQYTISIQQGMRCDTLAGIKEVGLKIINNGKE